MISRKSLHGTLRALQPASVSAKGPPGLTRPNQSPSPPISQIISRRQAWSSPASAASRAYTRTVPGWTYVGPVTPHEHEARAVTFGRTALERHLIFKMADCVERFTG